MMSEDFLYNMQDFNKMLQKQIKEENKEIKRLTELCNKYEEEHKTTYEIWKKDIERIDKAIDYIEKRRNSAYIIRLADGGIELINILRGDKE